MTVQLVVAFFLGAVSISIAALWALSRQKQQLESISSLELSHSESSLADLKQSLTAANDAMAVMQGSLGEVRLNVASLTERLQARQVKIDELLQDNTQLSSDLDRQRSQLSTSREEAMRLSTSLEEQQNQTVEKLALLGEAKETLQTGFKNLANEIFEAKQREFKEQSKEQLNGVLDPLHERIKAFEKRVEQSYNDESKERFSLVKEVRNLQDLNKKISQDAINLTSALKGESKTQGMWGELMLERVFEQSGLEKGREYELQVSLKSPEGQRFQPDAIVRLPEGKDIIVDSKVSLTAYERFCSSEDQDMRAESLKQHLLSFRQHIKQLSAKEYQNLQGIQTLDFVLLFVPIEAAFALAIREDQELLADAFGKNVIIVTPSTLLVTLRTIQNLWRYEQQNKNAQEIADGAGKLYDKFVGFVADLELIGSGLSATQNAYEKAFNKLSSGRGNLVKRADDMKLLGAKVSKSLPTHLIEAVLPDHRVIEADGVESDPVPVGAPEVAKTTEPDSSTEHKH